MEDHQIRARNHMATYKGTCDRYWYYHNNRNVSRYLDQQQTVNDKLGAYSDHMEAICEAN